DPAMSDKVILVTGATGGIGREAAQTLAEQGYTLVLVGRNAEKLARTQQQIQQACKHDRIDTIQADLSSMQEVRRCAQTFLERHDRLDVLLNNAGALFQTRTESVDGHEMTLALNHLHYFLLTHLLLDVLKKTAASEGEARIVNVSSDAHRMATKGVDFSDLQAHKYSGFRRYGESKLMNILFTFALARRIEGTQVTTTALHPGFVNTGFGENNKGWMTWMFKPLKTLFARNEAKGAATSVYLCSSYEAKGINGAYFVDCKQRKPRSIAHDIQQQEQLWQRSEELCNLEDTLKIAPPTQHTQAAS
ncbi:MAG: SDR family oxidoreductase, partial [Myxococcota bacterium]